jgi:hypothetical protein
MTKTSPQLDPDLAAATARTVLDALNKVGDIAKVRPSDYVMPPSDDPDAGLRTPMDLAGDWLHVAKEALDRAITVPQRAGDRETNISREGILLTIEPVIQRLAAFLVEDHRYRTEEITRTIDPYRLFVWAATTVNALLASPTFALRAPDGRAEETAP